MLPVSHIIGVGTEIQSLLNLDLFIRFYLLSLTPNDFLISKIWSYPQMNVIWFLIQSNQLFSCRQYVFHSANLLYDSQFRTKKLFSYLWILSPLQSLHSLFRQNLYWSQC